MTTLRDLFEQGLTAVLGSWSTLQLAIQHDEDGVEKARVKGENLHQEIMAYFGEYGSRVDVDDMMDFLEAFFTDVFTLVVEDGSLQETAHVLCRLFMELRQQQRDTLDRVLQAYAKRQQSRVSLKVQCVDQTLHNQVEEHEVDSEYDYEVEQVQEVDMDQVEPVMDMDMAEVEQQQPPIPPTHKDVDEEVMGRPPSY